MSKVNKVCISDSGKVYRNKAKNVNKRKRETFNNKEEPVSRSQDIEDAGVYKGARVLSASVKEKTVSFRHGEYKGTDDSPKPDYDGRVHPHWKK